MRAAVWRDPNQIELTQVDMPTPPQGWAVVKIAYNGICGTDLAIYHGQHPRAETGLIPGHEMVGWVADPGSTGLDQGSVVAVMPLISCGTCRACRSNNAHVCNKLNLYGIDAPGGMAEYVALPGDVLYPLPAGVDVRTAALTEPLAVAVHAISLSNLLPGDLVAVWGAGPIGMLTAMMARYSGAREIIICEPNAYRSAVAAKAGFTATQDANEFASLVAERSDGDGADITFDCAAHPAVAPQLAEHTRVRGQIVVVGVYKQPAEIVLRDVGFKEQTIVGVRVYTKGDMRFAVDLVSRENLDFSNVPTLAYPVEQVAEAFEAATSGNSCLKVLVTPNAELADVLNNTNDGAAQ